MRHGTMRGPAPRAIRLLLYHAPPCDRQLAPTSAVRNNQAALSFGRHSWFVD